MYIPVTPLPSGATIVGYAPHPIDFKRRRAATKLNEGAVVRLASGVEVMMYGDGVVRMLDPRWRDLVPWRPHNPITTYQAAEELGVGVSRIRQLILRGRLPAVKQGRDWMIARADLDLIRDRKPGRPAVKN